LNGVADKTVVELEQLRGEREQLVDALDHIQRTCAGSRTQTRRLRWIALRAKCAIEGSDEWRVADVPINDPLVERLRELLKMIFPIAAAEFQQLVSGYTAPEDQRRLADDVLALIETINERDVHADCLVLREFLLATRRNVPEINIEELRKGGDWIELT
jgi:hypothetical protein